MLNRLCIQNYVIIDELEIRFSPQLNVITGETGAGKSIIIGALDLILGQRADMAALVNKERKCVIEGVFSATHKPAVSRFLQEYDLDETAELTVRREISPNGKSRAFINDTPVTLAQLQELSLMLVDLHQQFDTLELSTHDFQREVLDALAGQNELVSEYRLQYERWKALRQEMLALQEKQQQFDKEADYNRFQYTELEEAGFRENELEETETELKKLNNAEGIRAALDRISAGLSDGETPVVQLLRTLSNQLSSYTGYHPDLPVLLQRLQSAQIELQDIAGDVDRISNQVNLDPQRIEELNERLSLGYKLQKKHGVTSTAGLLLLQQQLGEKLQAVLHIAADIRKKEQETDQALEKAGMLAARISTGRKKQVSPLEEKVNKLLAQVGMPNARLKVTVSTADTLNASGTDQVEFLFNANLSATAKTHKTEMSAFAPVRKVASGGELSRLMLCIKSLVAQSVDLPTMIFDEIDTGISGEAARQVGLIMRDLAAKRQVICITHQPQIAGKADAHFFVYKEIAGNQVRTNIRRLTTDERITAIAQMLSGEKPTAAALENAREMVMN